jgi:hypothetical protein
METTAQATWFVLDRCPETRYRAVEIGAGKNGRPAPVVTAPTLVALLLDAVSDLSSSYLAFAIDTSGRCTLQDPASPSCGPIGTVFTTLAGWVGRSGHLHQPQPNPHET